MKVTAIATWFPTEKAPASESFIVKDLRTIAKTGAKVWLIHLVAPRLYGGSRRVNHEDTEVVRIPFDPFSPLDLGYAGRLPPIYLRGSDLVHSTAMSALAPVLVGRPAGISWAHTEHWSGLTNPDTLGLGLRTTRPVILGLERLPDVVTAVCPYLSALLRMVRPHKPMVEIPCAVEPVANLVEHRVLNAPSAPWRLVPVGGLAGRKDPLFALRMMQELQRRGRETNLTWVGARPLEAACRDYAAEHGLDLRLTGALPYEGVSREPAAADMFIGPTHGDNLYVSCAEAILRGRPTVVGDAGGHPDYVRSTAGEALPHHDPGDYADAVEAQILDNQYCARDITATIGTAFSEDTVGASYVAVYRAMPDGKVDSLWETLPSRRGWQRVVALGPLS